MNPPHDDLDDDWAAAMHEIAAREPSGGASAAPPLDGDAGRPPRAPTLPPADLDFFLDIGVTLSVELGRRKLSLRELQALTPGTVLDLDAYSGDPVQVLINGTPVAKGDIIVINDQLGVRLTDIISPGERLRRVQP